MAWNISIMCVKASKQEIDEIIPDVLYKSEENLFFEDVTSYKMEKAMGITELNGWIIITDVVNRVTHNEEFPLNVSKSFEVKTFYISENPIFRAYSEGKPTESVKGIEEFKTLLNSRNIEPKDAYGETKSIQLFEYEILNGLNNGWGEHLFRAKFDKYELD
ncbi:hypothetical protein [Olleya sp. HaHaR_3_96]|uniref:hypothetical protein n=1 Tax=Olleya sp. HaHaR_3_96 TaxID=2745560 RepID=UPI001C4F257F|nr:hypothetical protein [Olleya sp. HaHaR_3_96]QXP61543.1 hypothetical protein H0I26_07915 [Olleya sp. HaHaR_3_96]